jgi:hypothetical protein
MLTPSPVIIPAVVTQLLAPFRTIMTAPTLANGEVLVCGGILAPGCRTITAALRAMGLVDEKGFTRYHRFFNRATYAALLMSQVLLVILVTLFLSVGAEILIVFDASIERRYGPEVHYKRCTTRGALQRVLPGCRAFYQETCGAYFWHSMAVCGTGGDSAMEFQPVGSALPMRARALPEGVRARKEEVYRLY